VEDRETDAQEHAISPLVPAHRLPYRSPALVEYGNVSKLTEGGGGSMTDQAGKSMTCL
jgi:hypothetical protein